MGLYLNQYVLYYLTNYISISVSIYKAKGGPEKLI